jgi:hypothetical protein
MKQSSPDPFTRCGDLMLEGRYVRVSFTDTNGVENIVFLGAGDLTDCRYSSIPVLRLNGGEYQKVGHATATRSPSGRGLVISVSNLTLTCEWANFQKVVHKERRQVPVFRLNAPLI